MTTTELTAATRNALTTRVLAGNAFLIKTPPGENYLIALREWLGAGAMGGIVIAKTRTGKTSTTRWVLQSLAVLFGGQVPFIQLTHRKATTDSPNPFFQHLLDSANHEFERVGTTADKRKRWLLFLVGLAQQSSIATVILSIDEASKLRVSEILLLLEISNEVELAGYRVFVLMTGLPELKLLGEQLILGGVQEQLYERFFANEHVLAPLLSVVDIEQCLGAIDNTRYPVGQDKSVVQLYLPEAWEVGFRMRSVAPQLYEAFNAEATAVSGGIPFEVRMGYFFRTVMPLLNRLADQRHVDAKIPDTFVREAVTGSKFRVSVKQRVHDAGGGKGKP